MNAEAWQRAKSLLADAADLPASDRARFVADRCPDLELRRELLELLASPAPGGALMSVRVEPGLVWKAGTRQESSKASHFFRKSGRLHSAGPMTYHRTAIGSS